MLKRPGEIAGTLSALIGGQIAVAGQAKESIRKKRPIRIPKNQISRYRTENQAAYVNSHQPNIYRMKSRKTLIIVVLICVPVVVAAGFFILKATGNTAGNATISTVESTDGSITLVSTDGTIAKKSSANIDPRNLDEMAPLPNFLQSGIVWLSEAQAKDGGWGAGSHSRQDVRDPHAVQTDPATTAFTALAIVRAGNSLTEGPYHQSVRKALEYLLKAVENTEEGANNITKLSSTQPQSKLGRNIDVSMTTQFLTRVTEFAVGDETLEKRIAEAIQKCVTMIEKGQNDDGSFRGGSWAGVLSSTMANNALEQVEVVNGAYDMDVAVDKEVLEKSREYQAQNVDASGTVKTEAAAGIELYAFSSTKRATERHKQEAEEVIRDEIATGALPADAVVSEENLMNAGISEDRAKTLTYSYQANGAATQALKSEDVLSGFGNNGGEEFLSYMMTSESMVLEGGKEWDEWNEKMVKRLSKIQNKDGSWNGHHCITSPVFCTAAVIATLTVERDMDFIAAHVDTDTNK